MSRGGSVTTRVSSERRAIWQQRKVSCICGGWQNPSADSRQGRDKRPAGLPLPAGQTAVRSGHRVSRTCFACYDAARSLPSLRLADEPGQSRVASKICCNCASCRLLTTPLRLAVCLETSPISVPGVRYPLLWSCFSSILQSTHLTAALYQYLSLVCLLSRILAHTKRSQPCQVSDRPPNCLLLQRSGQQYHPSFLPMVKLPSEASSARSSF